MDRITALAGRSRFGVLLPGGIVFVGVSTLLRAALLVRTAGEIAAPVPAWIGLFFVGLLFDVVAFSWIALPAAIVLAALPERIWVRDGARAVGTALLAVFAWVVLVGASVEWAFWEEFGARFNFIAVDYLVYTKEVVGNIRETYPVEWILPALALPAAGFAVLLRAPVRAAFAARTPARPRWTRALAATVLPVASFFALDDSAADLSGDRYVNELARNGTYSLFSAFWKNRLDYDAYYAVRPLPDVLARLRDLVSRDGSTFLPEAGPAPAPVPSGLLRRVTNPGPEKRLNVVLVTVESLSCRFLAASGDARGQRGITPRLDALVPEGLWFERCYATGIRTVRGLEALSLSVPPTPGQSVVKRPGSEGMFTLGQLFRERGYDTAFVYGGYGIFDSMNAFFGGNGFRTVDRSDLSAEEITFSNVWGVCDEDLFRRTLVECDRAHAAGTPFLRFVMTTSNHQPFTYPAGRIDIPSGDGRDGSVKYTDHAIGAFLDAARTRPWFDDTIFVIVADHCASARGNTELPVETFHVPLLVWSPKHVRPGRVPGVCSQVDVAPTLLGLLGFSYDSRFFGQDVLARPPGRAFLCNYLALGYYDGERLVTLGPKRTVRSEDVGRGGRRPRPLPRDATTTALEEDAIAWFQGAAWILDTGRHRAAPAATSLPAAPAAGDQK